MQLYKTSVGVIKYLFISHLIPYICIDCLLTDEIISKVDLFFSNANSTNYMQLNMELIGVYITPTSYWINSFTMYKIIN